MIYDIDDLPQWCETNSRRWFPHLHDRSITTINEHVKHLALGLGEEAGEVQGLIKKLTGYSAGQSTHSGDVNYVRVTEELADVLVYVFNIFALIAPALPVSEVLKKVQDKCDARWGAE